jgi:hypothetical protein
LDVELGRDLIPFRTQSLQLAVLRQLAAAIDSSGPLAEHRRGGEPCDAEMRTVQRLSGKSLGEGVAREWACPDAGG